MLKNPKSFKLFLSFLFLFSIVFFIASEHENADCDCMGCGMSLTIMNNTQSEVKLALTSSETEVVTMASNSKTSFNLKKGVYKWIAYDKNTNKIISSGVINLDGNNQQNIINIRQ